MRTIIAGGRDFQDAALVEKAMAECGWTPSAVLCGGANGADALGKAWAEARGIPVEMFRADWDAYGKAAGPIRNAEMARRAEALVAFPTAASRGTWDMVRKAQAKGMKVVVVGP